MIDNEMSIDHLCQWDNNAVTWLYRHYYRLLVSYVMDHVDNRDAAQDIVQEVFTFVWQQKLQFVNHSQLRTYIYRSVKHKSLDHLRHCQVEQRYASAELKKQDEQPIADEDSWDKEEIYRHLFDAIDALPERQREIFQQAMAGKKNAEIAQCMNISIETVKTHKKRGLARLREALSDEQLLLILAIC